MTTYVLNLKLVRTKPAYFSPSMKRALSTELLGLVCRARKAESAWVHFLRPRCAAVLLLIGALAACDRPDHAAADADEAAMPGLPVREIAIVQHPRQTMSGRVLKPSPTVQLSGGAAGALVRVDLIDGRFEPSSVTEVTTDADGRAVFDNLVIAQADAIYRLEFSADGFEPVVSKQFNIVFGPPRKMAVLSQPMDSRAGQPLEGGAAVLVTDEAGNPVPDINVRVRAQPDGVVISSGDTIEPTDNRGIAIFADLVIKEPVAACHLVFESLAAGVNPVTTADFAVKRDRQP